MMCAAYAKKGEVTKGTYALVLLMHAETDVCVGRLGVCRFPPGYYVYVGSARGGLRQRLARHLRMGKKLRWHIDYLREHAGAVEVWYAVSEERLECRWNNIVAAMPSAGRAMRGFGSSDCRCRSHLVYFRNRPNFEEFRSMMACVDVKRLPLAGWPGLEML